MKKFLSLLLAMTMVMSLIVLPARAEDATVSGTFSVTPSTTSVGKGDNVTFSASASSAQVDGKAATVSGFKWKLNSGEVISGQTGATYTVALSEATTATCIFTLSYNDGTEESPDMKTVDKEVTSSSVSVSSITSAAIQSYTLSGRTYTTASDIKYIDDSELSANAFTVAFNTVVGRNITVDSCTYNTENSQLTIKAKNNGITLDDISVTLNPTKVTSATKATIVQQFSDGVSDTRMGQTVKIKATYTPLTLGGNTPTYVWKLDGNTVSGQTTDTLEFTASKSSHKVTVTAKEGSSLVTGSTSDELTISVKNDDFEIEKTPNTTLNAAPKAYQDLSFTFKDKNKQDVTLSNISWSVSGGAGASITGSGKAVKLYTGTTAGNLTAKATFKYLDKNYTVTYDIKVVTLSADLNTTYYGANNGYYTSASLVSPADSAVRSYAGAQLSVGESVSTVTINTTGYNAGYLGTFSGVSNTTITFTPTYNQFGKATFTGIATTNLGKRFAITFSIPVTPVPVNSFDSQTAEPVSTTTVNTNYKVSAPYGYTKFYVLGNSNSLTASQTVDYSRYSATQLNSMGYAYTTIPSTYFSTSGQCTLYVIAWNDSTSYTNYSKYYCGPMTVTQTNYNINYNGVAGETVQFKHTDFTNFMNEVSQARGDSSKTSSYPYVTFSYVTFDYPSTAQGTLYYNGTAMSNSSYSGAFNSRTQITNLDNITFVPYAKTSAKNVAVTFTLHAVKYGTNGTVVNRDLPYKGTVNISLVREDIKYTVAPGDAVTFTDSDFLNYLRAQSGINYNYNIDYVTFDQSAVDTINGGVLYSGYAGYNQVKTTDKFYYTTTNNYTQNALSDVTFRASLYAKTGTTVYIPFTIYAKYGTSGAATRQVTGTVAVKIAQTMNFVDVKPTDYFYNPVKWAVTKNITKGTSAVTFSPDKTCTRAEIVTFLWRDAGSPMPTISRNPFSDVSYSMGADFYNAILWASQNGITAGTTTTTFAPNKTCTRAEIVTFLWRYAKKPVGYGSNSFTDVNKNDHAPYYDAILWAVSKGITNGSTTTTFAPNGTCTRAQAVTFLYRYEGGK